MGNKLGWFVAGVILVGILAFVAWNLIKTPSYELVNLKKTQLELKDLTVPIDTVVAKAPTAPGNAAVDYGRALEVYRAHEKEIIDGGKAIHEKKEVDSKSLDLLKEIAGYVAAGAGKASMDSFVLQADKKYKFTFHMDVGSDLQDIMGCQELLGDYHINKKEYPQAEKALFDGLIMGWQMERERARIRMVSLGIGIQGVALKKLVALYELMQKNSAIAAVEKYHSAILEISDFYRVKRAAIWCAQPERGDVFGVLEQDQDHAWRVEATMVLGILKFMWVNDPATMKTVNKYLDKALASTDTPEREAARAAKDLTQVQYNRLASTINE